MKFFRRRLAAAILSLALVLSMMPAAGLTAWAGEGDNTVSTEETAGEEAGKTEGTEQQTELKGEENDSEKGEKGLEMKLKAEGDDEGSSEDGEDGEDQGEAKGKVSLGEELVFKPLKVGYTSEEAAANRKDIVIKNTGSTEVTVSPEYLTYYSSDFKWVKSKDGARTLAPGEQAVLGTVEPKAGLAADWYAANLYYSDDEHGLSSSTTLHLTVLKDGLSMDVYDEDGSSIDLFDLGSQTAGSDREVSRKFYIMNTGTEPFELSLKSTNDLFIVSADADDSVFSEEAAECSIKVDPQRIKSLAAGTYTGYVTASAKESDGTAAAETTIPVSFKVTEKPEWSTAEVSDIYEAGNYGSFVCLYIANTEAFGYDSEEYLKAELVEGDGNFALDDDGEVWKDRAYLGVKEGLAEGTYTAKIRLMYDATGRKNWDKAENLGTMTYTLNVVEKGSFGLSVANDGFDPDTPVIDLGVLTTGYTEKDAKELETVLRFKNSGKRDLDVSGKGFGYYFYKNGDTFVWNEGSEAVALKPGDEYKEIRIRPQTGKKAGLYYDYFYFRDDNGRCETEVLVRYLVADEGQSIRIVDSGGFFGEEKEIEEGGSAVFTSSHTSAGAKKYYKWIDIYNTGREPLMLSVPKNETCNDIYTFAKLGSEAVKVEPGKYKTLRIELETKGIAGTPGTYDGSFTVKISDENGENVKERTVPVKYAITDKSYHVSLDLQGRGSYDVKKAEADFPAGTTYKAALASLNSVIVGDQSNRWPVDDKYAVVGFTKKKDSELKSWDELIAAQAEIGNEVIDKDTELYVNWAQKIQVADVTAVIPACGTPAGTAVAASVDRDAHYKLRSATWKDMEDKDVLEGENAYPLEVRLAADFGYAFAEDSGIRINGVYSTKTTSASSVIGAAANRRVTIEHSWDKGRITRPATIYRRGVKTYTCTGCGKEKTEKISIADAIKETTEKIGEKIAEWLRKISGGINPYVPYDPYDPDEPDDPDPQEDPDTPDELSITLSDTGFVYNGKRQVPEIEEVTAGDVEFDEDEYEVVYPKKSTDAGDYEVTVKVKAEGLMIEGTAGYSIVKADNPVSVRGKTASVKYKKLKKKAQTVSASSVMNVRNAKGRVTYALSSVSKAKYRKYFSVNASNGNVSVKKKLRKGTYTLTVKVNAAGDKNHNAASRYVSFRIRVR